MIDYLQEYFGQYLEIYEDFLSLAEPIAAFISGVLFVFAVYYFFKLDIWGGKRKEKMDVMGKDFGLIQARGKWADVVKKLDAHTQKKAREAVADSEKLLEEFLKMKGFRGKSLDERLKKAEENISNMKELKKARQVFEKLKKNEDLVISSGEARNVVFIYKQTLKDLGMF